MTGSDDLLSLNKRNRRIKKRLEAVAENPGNRTCTDCPEGEPRWASLLSYKDQKESHNKPLAVLCCSQCSQLHQQLGEQVCQVKSIKAVDQWSEDDVEALEDSLCNLRVNQVYEGNFTANASVYNKQVVLENPTQDAAARLEFIRDKYQDKAFFDHQLYLDLVEEAQTLRSKIRTRQRTKSPVPRLPAKSLSEDESLPDPRRRPRKKSKSFRGLSRSSSTVRVAAAATSSSDESNATPYTLPTHLGPGSSRQRSSSRSRLGSRPNASAKTRRGRRKTHSEKSNSEGLKSSSSTPSLSRWNTAPPLRGEEQRWKTQSGPKNFRWDSGSGSSNEASTSDITSLRDSVGNNGFKPRAPQRVASDDDNSSGKGTTRHQRLSSLPLRLPSRVLSDEDDSARRERGTAPAATPLRMPRRVVSDESGSEDTDRSDRTMPTIDPASLLARRRSLPSLNMNAKDDEDSIRNQYGGPNCVFSGHKQRTAGAKAEKPAPKYGIKLKYGFDSATDTDSERRYRRTKPKELERPHTEELANVPTLGCLLAAHPEAPNRILDDRSAAVTSDEEAVAGVDTNKPSRRKYRRTRSQTRLTTRRSDLYSYLNESKSIANQRPSSKAIDLAELEKIDSDISMHGFCFESSTDDDVSSVSCRPRALTRRRSCKASLGLAKNASGLDDSAFSISSRASVDNDPAYD